MRNLVIGLCVVSLLFVGCGRRRSPEDSSVSQRPEASTDTENGPDVDALLSDAVTPEPTPTPVVAPTPAPMPEPTPETLVVEEDDHAEQDARFQAFWNDFRAAVTNDDRRRVFELTRFPLTVDNVPDVPYTRVTERQLRDDYDRVFNIIVRQEIMTSERPERSDRLDGAAAYRLTIPYYAKDGAESLVILEFEDVNGQFLLGQISG